MRQLTSIIKKNKKTIITIVILLILVNILNVLAPYFLKLIIDKITTNIIRKRNLNNFSIIYSNQNFNNFSRNN